jgi:hypothetical protein
MPSPLVTLNGNPNYVDLSPLVSGGILVTLAVQNSPANATYNWTIVDQPPNPPNSSGAQAVLSGPTTPNPTFTLSNTGSYLVQCVLNQGLSSQQAITGVAFARQLISGERIPAANESVETDGLSATEAGAGWAVSLNSLLRRLDALTGDPGVVVGIAGSNSLTKGSFVAPGLTGTSGSPKGPDGVVYPAFSSIAATNSSVAHGMIGVVIGGVNGGPVGAIGDFILVRWMGLYTGITYTSAPTVGNPIYVTNGGTLDVNCLTASSRVIGTVAAVNTTANTFDVFLNQAP